VSDLVNLEDRIAELRIEQDVRNQATTRYPTWDALLDFARACEVRIEDLEQKIGELHDDDR
jgi:hypothetical protein